MKTILDDQRGSRECESDVQVGLRVEGLINAMLVEMERISIDDAVSLGRIQHDGMIPLRKL